MSKFGLIGFPLQHSFSKKFFEEKFVTQQLTGYSYQLFPLQSIQGFLPLIASVPGLKGLNVTIPYKQTVIPFLNQLDKTAKAIGAVNCIKITNGYLTGYNTDAPAFKKSLHSFLPSPPRQTFVLGTGGSAKAVGYALHQMDIPFLKVSRNPATGDIVYNQIAQHLQQQNLFINTTPLGMFPEIEGFPDIPYQLLGVNDLLFDLVYNPSQTVFLKLGKKYGAQTKNGLEMLHLQAEKSWEIWNQNI